MSVPSSHPYWLATLPNKLTLGRMAAVPVILFIYPFDFFAVKLVSAIIFALAAMTDFLDGYLARKYNTVTPLGRLLDPIADKMLVACSLVLLAYAGSAPVFIAGILVGRDIAVSGLRLMAMEEGLTVEVSDFGKWKTAVQDVAIFCLLINQDLWSIPFRTIGMLSLWAALALALFSGYQYCQKFLSETKININL